MRSACLFPVLLLAATAASHGEKLDPAKWTLEFEPATTPSGSRVLARLEAKIESGWHLYSLTTPAGGPIPTTIRISNNTAVESLRVFEPTPKRALDPNFNIDTETYEGQPVFLVELDLKKDAPAGPTEITAEVRYQMCNDRLCLPPVKRRIAGSLSIDAGAKVPTPVVPGGYAEVKPGAQAPASPSPAPASADSQGLAFFLVTAFGFGLAAIFTPCVFPMIPITMSYFLNRPSGSRRESVIQAFIFCAGIIVLFSGLGLLATAVLGPFGVVQLGSNVWVNGVIATVFLVFGLSLLGAFKITLPSGLLTTLNQKSEQGGTLGTLLMGLTFALASFACVGPFMGTLLAASVQSGGARPVLGMLVFAAGLALPFFLLALFPQYLKKMPRSGGWLARVKVVMGFILLAAMLKYASNIDQVLQLNWITRERFLAAWFVLFAMAGLYLLGLLRLEGIEAGETLGIARLLVASVFLIFALSLLPGMFGAPLGELDAYVPAATGGISGPSANGGPGWIKNGYREALDRAKTENKLVLVNFTGYACTNCHWMDANMFPRAEIADALKSLVLVELYTDGTDAASEENQKLQDEKFSTVAIPYYAIVDSDGKVIASFPGLTKNSQEFLTFLKSGRPAV